MRVIFYGQLQDIVGSNEIEIDHSLLDITALKSYLNERYPDLNSIPYLVAIDDALIQDHHLIESSSTVVFMPPFSGG